MDRTGLRAIVDVGVALVSERLAPLQEKRLEGASTDDDILTTLDRFTQLGTILIQQNIADIWQDLLNGFEEILRLGKPAQEGLNQVAVPEAAFLLAVAQRLFSLGGLVIRKRRIALFRPLVFLHPNPEYRHYYWSRYVVTMVSRGDLPNFRKSLIPPSSDYVRERAELLVLYDRSIDHVVNAMCQFDFLQCVAAVADYRSSESCYPNFGGYWNDRTLPIVRELIASKELRTATGTEDDNLLAEILRALDEQAGQAFFNFSGWSRNSWRYPDIVDFLSQHQPTQTRT